jgi:hypothetical protein
MGSHKFRRVVSYKGILPQVELWYDTNMTILRTSDDERKPLYS